jgi:hypothetical protein
MPRILDNIEQQHLPALRQAVDLSDRADFCVGYFNLRGWKQIACNIERWRGEGNCCRLLIGMQHPAHDELRDALSVADDLCNQLTFGAPTNEDEHGLRRLAAQIKARNEWISHTRKAFLSVASIRS